MNKISPHDRPTFQVAHLYRCHGLCGRENFLTFQERFEEIVNTIVNANDEDDLWKFVRSLFDYDDYADCVPINAANLSIVFNPVQLFMNSLSLDWNRDISYQKRVKPFVYTIEVARELVASQLNVEPDLVAFQRNGSDPNAVINNGLTFDEGDEVLVWNNNHPTGGDVAWKIRQDRFPQFNIVVLDLDGEQDPKKIVEIFLANVNSHTRLVEFSEVSHLNGMRLPAKQLCERIHEKNANVHVHVDGAQVWGALKHDLQDMGCDSYSAGSHKWFLGPKETGMLYMKRERIPDFAPKDIGYNGKMQSPPNLPEEPIPLDASRFEMVGQRNDTNLIGLLYTADLMDLIGFDRIGDRIKSLTTRLRGNLEKLQQHFGDLFEIETPPCLSMYHGIMVIKFKDPESTSSRRHKRGHKAKCSESAPLLSEQLFDSLYYDHKIGVSTKKGNRMRFSPHIYNTEEHMDRVVAAMKVELERILN